MNFKAVKRVTQRRAVVVYGLRGSVIIAVPIWQIPRLTHKPVEGRWGEGDLVKDSLHWEPGGHVVYCYYT